MAAAPSVNTGNKQMPIQESVMRLVCLSSIPLRLIPLGFILLGGCAAHGLRCDAHLTPINLPERPATPAEVKPSERASP
jgi:hypothetical protein